MKSRFLLVLLLFALTVTAQTTKPDSVPAAVTEGFSAEYPDARLKGWTKNGDLYIAAVRIDGQNAEAAFSSTGQWIETVFEISEKEMPGRISNHISANYSAYEVKRAQYKENKANGAFYFLELKKPRSSMETDMELYYDVTGNFMKKNDFHPITEAISTGTVQEAERKAREEKERKEYEERRAALLAMDRSITEEHMPPAVLGNFRKKFSKAEEPKWDSLDNVFTARFFLDEMPVSANFGLNGDWLSTAEDLTGGDIFRPVDQYLFDNYAGYRVRKAEKVTSRDRNNYFYVEIHEKARKGTEPPVTRLWFDKSGRLTKTEEPAPEQIAENTGADLQEERDEPDPFEISLEKESGKNPKKVKDKGAYNIPAKELPSSIQLYISREYPEYKVREAYFEEYEEVGMAYKVTISREGVNQQGHDFFFSEQGKLLLADNPPPRKEEPVVKPVQENVKPDQKEESEEIAEETPADEETEGEEETAYSGTQIGESEVPAAVKKSFSRRYPRAEEITWMEEEGKFMVEFLQNDVKNILEFTPDGVIQVTRTEIDPGTLFGPVQRILDDKFAGYKVRYAEKIVRKDRNNYFYVELYTRKKKISPQELELYFDKVGRLMENPPE